MKEIKVLFPFQTLRSIAWKGRQRSLKFGEEEKTIVPLIYFPFADWDYCALKKKKAFIEKRKIWLFSSEASMDKKRFLRALTELPMLFGPWACLTWKKGIFEYSRKKQLFNEAAFFVLRGATSGIPPGRKFLLIRPFHFCSSISF